MAVVQQLNDLYVVAMDYYIQHDLRKLQHFHRKLTSLLTHPKTLKNIQNTTTTEKQDNSYSRSLKCEMSKFNNEGMILVRSMLDGSEMKANNSKRAIIENIENQEALLKQRLLQRAKSKSITAPLRSWFNLYSLASLLYSILPKQTKYFAKIVPSLHAAMLALVCFKAKYG